LYWAYSQIGTARGHEPFEFVEPVQERGVVIGNSCLGESGAYLIPLVLTLRTSFPGNNFRLFVMDHEMQTKHAVPAMRVEITEDRVSLLDCPAKPRQFRNNLQMCIDGFPKSLDLFLTRIGGGHDAGFGIDGSRQKAENKTAAMLSGKSAEDLGEKTRTGKISL